MEIELGWKQVPVLRRERRVSYYFLIVQFKAGSRKIEAGTYDRPEKAQKVGEEYDNKNGVHSVEVWQCSANGVRKLSERVREIRWRQVG